MTQYETEHIRQLATLYWEGKIPIEDEASLFAFISESSDNRAAYALWEKDWRLMNEMREETDYQWRRLQNRMRLRDEVDRKRETPLWKKLSVAAAVAMLLIAATLGVRELTVGSGGNGLFIAETPAGGKSRLVLPDGSSVWLNAGSQIRYDRQFNMRERTVSLTGEAYFEIAKHTEKPFTVQLKDYEIEVTGTKFNVSAYENDRYATTTLMEGAVTLRCGEAKYDMKPGDMIQLDVQTKSVRKRQTNAEQYRSWTEGRIEFDGITLSDLLQRLSRQYGVQIHTGNEINGDEWLLDVAINNGESIDEILDGISSVTSVRYKRKGNAIYVSGK
jgi:ferric-dicitrate binding protein FerR (iron transport regulator)